jgi:heterodisulfide reductase subunit D
MTGSGPDLAAAIRRLKELCGQENVLTSREDLYVYSHVGPMGIERTPEPVAVLRAKGGQAENLRGDLSHLGLPVLRVDEPRQSVDEPYLLLDDRVALSLAELKEAVAERRRAHESREAATKTRSAPHVAAALLQSMEGYRLDTESGYCAVQRFLGGAETYSSKGRLLLCRGLANGELEATDKLADSIFNCTACGQCYDQHTSEALSINNAIIDARHTLVARGKQPARCTSLMRNLLDHGNPMGLDAEDRSLWYSEVAEEFAYRGNSVLYWPGCTTSYRLPEVVEATAKVLESAEVDFGVLGDSERCCGLTLYLLGQWSEAQSYASSLAEELKAREVDTLVTSCAGCYYAFKKVYRRLGSPLPFKVMHTSELYDQLLKEGRLPSMKSNRVYMWHDPCDLGRHCGVYDPPRRVLGAIQGAQLVEPVLSRRHAVCCGAGGGLWTYNEALTSKVAEQKVTEGVPDDVDCIVTGCPTCELNMRYAANIHRPGLTVADLSQVIAENLTR